MLAPLHSTFTAHIAEAKLYDLYIADALLACRGAMHPKGIACNQTPKFQLHIKTMANGLTRSRWQRFASS